MTTQYYVRVASAADASTIAQTLITVQKLHADAHPDYFKQPEAPDAFLHEVQRVMNEPNHLYLVAEEEDCVVGFLMAEILRRPENLYNQVRTTLYIHQLGVHPEHQHNGHGARLLDAAKALAKQEGLAKVALDTWEFNTKAQSFFKKQGFSRFNQRLWMEV
ncbi:MAG: GNAT family N-acetyltransferase [Caldilineaceae bacterium]